MKLKYFFVILFLIFSFLLSTSVSFASTTILGTTGLRPQGITIDSAGNIYTANMLNISGTIAGNVTKITPEGVTTILGATGKSPYRITIDPAGNIYTANSGSNNVTKITPEGVSSVLGTTGDYPIGITIDSAGNIYTANGGSNNVTKITPEGVSSILGTTGDGPFGITIDPAGNIYTSNDISNNVTKITPEGVSSILGTTGASPDSITIDPAGNVYTANSGSSNVTKITPEGVSSILGTAGDIPMGITIDPAGNIYTANSSNIQQIDNNVTKITPLGVSSIFGTTGTSSSYYQNGNYPYDITIDSAGNIYTANWGSNNVSKISISSVATVSSEVYTVNTDGSAGTITNVPIATSKADFLANIAKGEPYQTWDSLNVSDPVLTGDILLVLAEDGETQITYTIQIRTFTLSYTAGENGTIIGDTTQTVEEGLDGNTVTAVADEGYHFVSWSDGITTDERTDTNITEDLSVSATFAKDPTSSGSRRRANTIIQTLANPLPPTTPSSNLLQNTEPTICTLTLTLRQGNRGEQVKCLQSKLNITTDGIFGPITKASVILFQKNHNLVPDGVVGPKTKAKMLESVM